MGDGRGLFPLVTLPRLFIDEEKATPAGREWLYIKASINGIGNLLQAG